MGNNDFITLFFAGTILFVILAFYIIYFILINKQKQSRLLLKTQSIRFEEQERTMMHISKEVHDNIGQQLNMLLMHGRMIEDMATSSEQIELIENSNNILNNLIAEAHNISHSLNGDYIKKRGLFDVLQSQLKYAGATKGIDCSIELIGHEKILTSEEEVLVYRIAQEAVQNTMKHANAKHLKIKLINQPSKFLMQICDDGIGFDSTDSLSADGIGIMNIHERVKILNGSLQINSSKGNGCKITLIVDKVIS